MSKIDPKLQSGSQQKSTRELKDLLEIIKNKVDHISASQAMQSTQIHFIRDQQSVINEKLDVNEEKINALITTSEEHSDKLDTLQLSVVETEQSIRTYGDMYQKNRDKIDGLDTRLTKVEGRLAVAPAK